MLVAAAVCPAPPLLVPEVAAGAAAELGDARTACSDALAVLAASRPDLLVVVGAAAEGGGYDQGTPGSFAGFGVDLTVTLGPDLGEPPSGQATGAALPASLAVGGWLLGQARWSAAPVAGVAVAEDLPPSGCGLLGADLGRSADRVAMLVLGDGSACRTLKAPGYLDERAAAFDAAAARALGAADVAALAGIDAALAADLQAAGRAPWQVLAGAAEGADLTGRLLYEDAPYGVGYFVAAWS
ncbi:class III extradiol dioxygenase subunit B-like domain-containing protein [Streptomyces yangpuensis]|uniref:class III extradiol dioxygenase subunit B-like domain-containing protein n=1 Tax=Streptomyces yangpuensis TaxID=1648182 RepID=UPI00062948FF|nr:class III extradiol dioxygenase subunit B-like domain-containing protein [Streptomyces yangpuensis]